MLVMFGFYKRKPGMSVEEFHEKWCGEYASLFTDTPEIARHMRRFIMHKITDDPTAANRIPYDGMSEVWIDKREDLANLQAEPFYTDVIAPLGATFLDISGPLTRMIDVPHFVVGSEPPLVDR